MNNELNKIIDRIMSVLTKKHKKVQIGHNGRFGKLRMDESVYDIKIVKSEIFIKFGNCYKKTDTVL